MIFLLKVLYNQYYLFYKRFEIFGEEPDTHARYSLLLNIIFFLNPAIGFLLTYLFCYQPSRVVSLAIPLILILLIEIMHWKGYDKKVIEQNPQIFNSSTASRIFAISFLVLSYIFTFSIPSFEKDYIDSHCGSVTLNCSSNKIMVVRHLS